MVYVIQYIVIVKKKTPIRNEMRKLLPGDLSLIHKIQKMRQNQETKKRFGNKKGTDNNTADRTIEPIKPAVFLVIKFRTA
jgi:uncharacterized protein YycO